MKPINQEGNIASHYVISSHDDIELFEGSFTTYQFKPHFHESYSIIFVDKGIGDYSINSKQYMIPAGSFLIFNPYEVHAGRSVEGLPWSFRSMYISKDIMKNIMLKMGETNELPFFTNNKITNPDLFEKGKNVYDGLKSKIDHATADHLFSELIGALIHDYSDDVNDMSSSNGFAMACEVRDYIHGNYLEDISLADLSQIAGVSQFSLVKHFKTYFQLPPRQYLINLRIEKAKKLLCEKYSATEVAYKSGFFDQSHFIRHFKKILGITPKQFASKIA